MAGAPGFNALTLKSNGGRLGQLISDLSVSIAYDLRVPPTPLPGRVAVKALWDTGATRSVISEKLAQDLSLVASGATNVNHAGGVSVSPTYMVNFFLPNIEIVGVQVTQWEGAANFGAIIGMDIITLGDLAITNHNNVTWMTFRIPSHAAIDYVAEANRILFRHAGRNDPCPCGSGKKYKQCHYGTV